MDSTYLKGQQKGARGRKWRYAQRGSTAVKLERKRWILSAQSLPLFGRRLAWQRQRHSAKARRRGDLTHN
jgi:hypothetical protein